MKMKPTLDFIVGCQDSRIGRHGGRHCFLASRRRKALQHHGKHSSGGATSPKGRLKMQLY